MEQARTGMFALLLGLVAMVGPQVFTFAINILIDAILLAGGVSEIIRGLRHRPRNDWGWACVIGVLYGVGGVFLLFDPLAGVSAITLVGGDRLRREGHCGDRLFARLSTTAGLGWLAVSGIASIAVGILVWSGWPDTAMWPIGILAGVELVLFGLALIAGALTVRPAY